MKTQSLKTALGFLATFALVVSAPAWSYEEPDETIFKTMSTTQPGVTWGLDRVDGVVDGNYKYTSSGSGVLVYVVDTGVDATLRELNGRVLDGFDAFYQDLDRKDCHGHGTHVAAIIAGSFFGVAKKANIVPVRVLNCVGVGNTQTLLAGINWILETHPGGPGIVNMSLGGPRDAEINLATTKLISAGLVVVAAAGNSNVDACTFSPASAPGVIAVGASDSEDRRATFSNWGSCVDIFAPGVSINSANALNHSISQRRSGTSQSSPFVSGAIATYMSSLVRPSVIRPEEYLYQVSEPGMIKDSNSNLNFLVNVEKIAESPVEPVPEVVTPEEPAEPDAPIVEVEPVSPGVPAVPEVIPIEEPAAPDQIEEPAADINPVPEETLEPDPRDSEGDALIVLVTQQEPGSSRGLLEWSRVPLASHYVIYKTGSIRPGWRMFGSSRQGISSREIIDKPGEIAIYRVVAIVDSKEVEIGEYMYMPTK